MTEIAYQIDDQKLTYEELEQLTNKYKEYLKQGDSPIIIYGEKEIDTYIAIISCLKAKRTYVPVSTKTPIERLKEIIKQTKSKLIITNENINIENKIKLNELNQYKDKKTKENNIAYIIFTSGSTGNPKGVPITYENLENFINWISNLEPLKTYKNIRVLNQASFSFDLSVADLYYSLKNHHTLVAYSNQDYFEKLKNTIDVAVMTPTFMKMCLLDKEFNEKNSKLKCVYFCGETLEPKTVEKLKERFKKIEIINAYGPTEATSAVSAIRIEKIEDPLPVGDMNNTATKIEIINNEIVLKGKSVFEGYLNNVQGGYYKENNINCYKTKDIGYIKDNKLYCKGRLDNQVKYKGYRIELEEIEKNINKIKNVESCAVIAIKENEITKTIKAFVTGKITEEEIKQELKNTLPEYMIPKTIKIIERMPINKNGKIDRKALK